MTGRHRDPDETVRCVLVKYRPRHAPADPVGDVMRSGEGRLRASAEYETHPLILNQRGPTPGHARWSGT